MKTNRLQLSLLACTSLLTHCLPADTRPEPGRVYVDAELAPELQAPLPESAAEFTTEDGYTVTLDTLQASIGNLELDGDDCNSYSEARYRRVLDFLQPGPMKVAQVFGLNDCQLNYSVTVPDADAVLGPAVTEEDRALMSTASVPVSSPAGVTTAKGMALHIRGRLRKGGVNITFDWGFSEAINFRECKRPADGDPTFALEDHLPLIGGETTAVTLVVEPRNLFVARKSLVPPLQVGADGLVTDEQDAVSLAQFIAAADATQGNDNGRVDLDELSATSVPGLSGSLAELLRTQGYPSMFLFAGRGLCSLQTSKRGHGPPL